MFCLKGGVMLQKKNIVYIVLVAFVIIFLIILIWQNISYKPIKIKSADCVEKIEIALTIKEETTISYDLEITEKDVLREIVDKMNGIKAKKILNGGGGEAETLISIKVYYDDNYHGEKLGYCVIYGNQILLSEGGKEAYRMNETDSKNLLQYILQLTTYNKKYEETAGCYYFSRVS